MYTQDECSGVSAMTLTALLTSGVEDALAVLSPQQLMSLENRMQMYRGGETPKKKSASRKRKHAEADENYDEGHIGHSGGQYMNLPASQPQVEIRDGIEWLVFSYSTRGMVQEFTIRTDIENLSSDEIPYEFKMENCVYPRALCPKEEYTGNRWDYETACNDLAWRLSWLNPGVMAGKRGLIQRAVDSFRNRYSESKSRRVIRQEKLTSGTLRRRTVDLDSFEDEGSTGGYKSVLFTWTTKDRATRHQIHANIESVNLDDVDMDFKRMNAIYPDAIDSSCEMYEENVDKWRYENECNIIGWKLTKLNHSKLNGQKGIIMRAVDAYRLKYTDVKQRRPRTTSLPHRNGYRDYGGNTYDDMMALGIGETVSNTLKRVIGENEFEDLGMGGGFNDTEQFDVDELAGRTVHTAEVLSNLC